MLRTPRDVAFVGCGTGHDAVVFATAGHRVTGFDFAPAAVLAAGRRAAERGVVDRCRFEVRDLFTLSGTHAGSFDAVVEYTCYCAIDPGRRAGYVANVAAILRPAGLLVALFFPMVHVPGGPPFPVSREEVPRLFAGENGPFDVLSEEVPADSAAARAGKEWLVVMRRR